MMRPDICLYHDNCADGFAAAWAIWNRWPDRVDFVPVRYNQPPPAVDGKNVLIVDFSYKAPMLLEMAKTAASIIVLDHHESAMNDLARWSVPYVDQLDTWPYCRDAAQVGADLEPHEKIQAVFDMGKSGAHLAWQHAHGWQTQLPPLIAHVEDRDLWRFAMPDTKAIHAYLMSLPREFNAWARAATQLQHPDDRYHLVKAGEAILRSQAQALDEAMRLTRRTITIAGYTVPVANVPKSMASDAANIMAHGHPFAATYFDTAAGNREFSLRSTADGVAVNKIAEGFGGGGHQHAAGFTVGGGWEGDAA